jgi:hypothetical protein
LTVGTGVGFVVARGVGLGVGGGVFVVNAATGDADAGA